MQEGHHSILAILQGFWQWLMQEDFQGYFGALVTCIENGRISLQHDMENSLGILMIQLSYLKLAPPKINGFGIATFGCLILKMTSLYFQDLHFQT